MSETKPTVFWLIRYLPPKTIGMGEIIGAIGASDMTIAKWRKAEPWGFEKPGFYTLMRSTGETLTVEPPKEEEK